MLPLATTPWVGMAIVGVAMMGAGGIYTLAASDLLTRVAPERVALSGSILAAAQSLILIIANPLIGASVTRAASYSPSAVALGLWVVPGCVVWLLWRRAQTSPPGQLDT